MAATAPSAFVGRETELARLTAALEAAAQGRAPAIIVEGESGAGKTRLLREFAAVAARRGATVLFGRCIDCGEAGPPYWPFIEALRSLPGSDERATSGGAARGGRPDADRAGTDAGGAARGGRPDADRAGTDAGGAARGGRPDADERAEPGTGAGGDRADADEGAEAGTSGGRDRAGFFERVLDRLEVSGRRSLVALLLDDLHWADRSTRDLLGFLLANLAGGPGPLVVATVRSEALVPGHPLVPLLAELRRSRRAEFLTLDRLGKGDVAAQLTSILGETPDPELLDEIWRRSEGNPFFVEELLAAARSGHELTSTLAPILAARLGALSPGARTAAGAVAASVGPVPHRILVQVAGVAEPALLAGLRECVDHHVLVADVRAGTYSFRHSLLREAAYAGLLPGEATRLHAAYGHALSATLGHVRPYAPSAAAEHPGAGDSGPGGATGGEATQLAAVAWHFYAAGDAERALPAALAAAVAAEAACGYAEAHVQYERALELAGRLPPEALELAFLTAAGPPSGTPVPEGGRLEGGGSLEGAGAEPAFLTAAGASSGTPVGDGSFDWVALAERAGEAAQLGGDPARAVVLLRLALAAARPEQASRLHLALGAALWAAGDSTGALSAYDAAIRHLSDPETAEAVRAAAAAAEARMLAGRYGESRRLAEDALALARRLGLPLEEAEILGTLGVDLAFLGEAGPAVAALDEAVAVAEKAGRPRPLARAWLNRVEVLSGPLNRLTEAADDAAAGLTRLRRLGLGRSYAASLAAALANTLFRLGRWPDADPVIDAALADRPTGAAAIELLLARARLAVGRGDFAAAHADLERIDHRWTQAAAPRYRAPLLTLSAGLALWEGRTADARAAVARALELVAGSDDVWLVAPVLWHGLRAEGDRAERARAVGDRAEAEAAARAGEALVERAAALQRGAAPAVRPVVAAYEALCRAEATRAAGPADPEATRPAGQADPEATRAAGTADPEAWAAAAEQWGALDQPYPSAYARLREAEAVLAGRARSARAGRALRAAHDVALRLGAEPFRREIEALARRARLALPQPDDDHAADGPSGEAAATSGAVGQAASGRRAAAAAPGPLDALTPRELDVLRLLAEGRTNKQVAAALFISEKTASVHVSHILAKLGVRTRVQAVAIAHQAGATAG